jgi:hypothetical protein
MKILHITYHEGCNLNINYVAKQLRFKLETQRASWNYNIGHERAVKIWNENKDYYNQFDVIITSDTAPLSRIFLQNEYKGKLIIWVCNRFDYVDQATNDCRFPDKEYYQLFDIATKKSNVKIFSYTPFEHLYAKKYRNIDWDEKIIKPCSFVEESDFKSSFENVNKKELFFIPPYHNDTIFMNLKEKCNELGINSYAGRYNGPQDLKGLKGIIHIPYAWSNLALFENWALGNVYLIPSKSFMLNLAGQTNFFWSPPFPHEFIEASEWYLPEHKELFIFFDSWSHLRELTNYEWILEDRRKKCLEFSEKHNEKTLSIWKDAIENWES